MVASRPPEVYCRAAMRVAICFAGAWRDWPTSWLRIREHMVDPLGDDVHIYAVSDGTHAAAGTHGRSDPGWTVARMRQTFGVRFRDGEQLTAAHMANVSGHTWPEIAATQAALSAGNPVFAYLYKIWRCGQLIHRSAIAYDVVIRMRPDLWPTQAFHLAHVPDSDAIELQVGGRCVRFGPRDVVIHSYTNFCGNDWFAIGGLAAMTVTMDLVRFWTPSSRFLSPDAAFDHYFTGSIEMAHNWLWWRTGTAVHRRPLFLELSRRRCTKPGCIRMPAWQVARHLRPPPNASTCKALPAAPRPPVGTMQPGRYGLVNDCGATTPGALGDLEMFTGPKPAAPVGSVSATALLAKKPKLLLRVEPPRIIRTPTTPSWARPDCGDVDDLRSHSPLQPCKKRTGDEASYQPEAHRPRVASGYGSALIFTPRVKGAEP